VTGETSNSITVDNTESCYYYCEVSNPGYPELKLKTKAVVFSLTVFQGVLEAEYNALIALYNSTNGDNWIDNTNWLSVEDVNDWHGIIADGVHVNSINFARNNLNGIIPAELADLSYLQELYLNENQLYYLPDLSSLHELSVIYLKNNAFTFEDFENIGIDFHSLTTCQYTPQYTLELINDHLNVNAGENLTLNCKNLVIETLSSTNNEFAVYKGTTLFRGWSSNPELSFPSFSASDEGEYVIQVRNANYPALVLVSDTLSLFVSSTGNHSPTNITLRNNKISEDSTIGSVVGNFITTDPNAGDSFTYSLATGDGTNDADNASFTIDGDSLKTAVALDYETQTSYHIYVQVEDAGGLSFDKAFIISVLNANEAPTALSITSDMVSENASIGRMIGYFSATDPDAGDSFSYSLITGDGTNDADNASFAIDGDSLKTAIALDYETQTCYYIYVQVEDSGGLSFEKAFVINVNDISEVGIVTKNSQNILIYPNPVSNYLCLDIAAFEEMNNYTMKVINSLGKTVMNMKVSDPVNRIDVRTWGSYGLYIWHLYDDKGRLMAKQKIILQ
jgi:hypothetical protein